MKKKKTIFLILAVGAILLAATLGGIAVAQADDTNNDQEQGLLDKVAEIYQRNTGVAIDPDELQKAIDEARVELRDAAIDKYLDKLVADGKITEEQAAQLKEWWAARPEIPTEEFRQWLDSRPDVDVPFGPGPGMRGFGKGRFGGFGEFRGGMRGWCLP